MNRTDAPAKQPKPFAINGQREDILPTTPAGDNTASYESGFPPITMTLKSAGGLPPKGQDMNQILFELSALARWSSAGALNSYDSSFATSISGYPKGSVLLGADGETIYINTVEGNTTNPNSGGAGWSDALTYLGFGSFPQYQTLGKNQHITQHGTGGSNSSGIVDIVFPKAYTTTNNLNVIATATAATPSNYIVTIGPITLTGVRIYVTGANAGNIPAPMAIGFNWSAIGR
ncbi:hypothetical protein ACXLRS_001581 [Citrobacter youngae]